MIDVDCVPSATPDLKQELLDRLREIVPGAFSDGQLDLERLKDLTGTPVASGSERYGLNWPGKRDAIAMLQAPSSATLVPVEKESVNFESARHAFVEGENLEVLKLLYKSYFGRVKLIYIDPPYNTGKDFIYEDDFADPLKAYLRQTGQMTESGDLTTSAPEKSGRFHSNWLSMMYPRLSLARQMLTEDGFIAISIDDVELPNLRLLCNDVFGEENFVAVLVFDRNRKNDAKLFSVGHEYMVVYARNRAFLKETDVELRALKEGVEELEAEFQRLREEFGDDWDSIRAGVLAYYDTFEEDDPRLPMARYRKVDKDGPYRTDGDISWPGGGGPRYDVLHPDTHKPCQVPKRGWVYPTLERMNDEIDKGHVIFGKDESTQPSIRRNLFEKTTQVMRSVIFSYAQTASQQFDSIFDDTKVFENPKSYVDLEKLIRYLSEPGDTVMDFFAGSNTTMHGVIRANAGVLQRRTVAVQAYEPIKPTKKASAANNALSAGFKTIAEIARERIRRVLKAGGDELETVGFRAFRLAPSNVRRWAGVEEKSAEAYLKQMEAFADTLVAGWTAENVIWEVALREGYPLTSTIELVGDGQPKHCWRVSDDDQGRSFIICLADTLDLEAVKPLGLGPDDLFVCRDTAIDDNVAANLALQCRLKVL
jgi:adenine-specific DNA-methyltransferase